MRVYKGLNQSGEHSMGMNYPPQPFVNANDHSSSTSNILSADKEKKRFRDLFKGWKIGRK